MVKEAQQGEFNDRSQFLKLELEDRSVFLAAGGDSTLGLGLSQTTKLNRVAIDVALEATQFCW